MYQGHRVKDVVAGAKKRASMLVVVACIEHSWDLDPIDFFNVNAGLSVTVFAQ